MTGDRASSDTEINQRTAECYVCGGEIDVQEDEWWQHRWEENPSEENVEKALEEREFRDWFVENKLFCADCHKEIIDTIDYQRRMA